MPRNLCGIEFEKSMALTQESTQQERTPISRSRRFVDGLVLGYAYQALVMVAGLWLTPFLLSHLGQHDYGLWLTALQMVTYLTLADFGMIALLPRTVAYSTGRSGGVENA